MLPIAILSGGGLILAIGISFNIELLANCGGLIFANLPLLFCAGITDWAWQGDGFFITFGWLSVMIVTMPMERNLALPRSPLQPVTVTMRWSSPTLQTVFGGLIVAIFVYLSIPFHIGLPQFLGFFGGKRFPTDYTAVAGPLSAIHCRGWIPVQKVSASLSTLVPVHNAEVRVLFTPLANVRWFLLACIISERAVSLNLATYAQIRKSVTGDIPVFLPTCATVFRWRRGCW